MSGVSKQANRQASGPVLQSVFLVVVAHSRMDRHTHGQTDTKFYEKRENEREEESERERERERVRETHTHTHA